MAFRTIAFTQRGLSDQRDLPFDGERTIRSVPDLASIDFLPPEFRRWASDHAELLALIAGGVQASGEWPSIRVLTRTLVRFGRAVPVQDVIWHMPKPLGHLEHNPDRAVLSLFGLRCTDAGMPLVDGFGRVLRLAIERYQGDDADPTIT